MFMTEIQLNNHNPMQLMKLLSLVNLHAYIENAFPEEYQNNGIHQRHLWRIDERNHQLYLLLVSPTKPDYHQLSKYATNHQVKIKNYDNYLDNIQPNCYYYFTLVATPTVTQNNQQRPVRANNQLNWLYHRANRTGVQFIQAFRSGIARPYLKHRQETGTYITQVRYQGLLKVTNKTKLTRALTKGIGHVKAYGCGLLTITPAR